MKKIFTLFVFLFLFFLTDSRTLYLILNPPRSFPENFKSSVIRYFTNENFETNTQQNFFFPSDEFKNTLQFSRVGYRINCSSATHTNLNLKVFRRKCKKRSCTEKFVDDEIFEKNYVGSDIVTIVKEMPSKMVEVDKIYIEITNKDLDVKNLNFSLEFWEVNDSFWKKMQAYEWFNLFFCFVSLIIYLVFGMGFSIFLCCLLSNKKHRKKNLKLKLIISVYWSNMAMIILHILAVTYFLIVIPGIIVLMAFQVWSFVVLIPSTVLILCCLNIIFHTLLLPATLLFRNQFKTALSEFDIDEDDYSLINNKEDKELKPIKKDSDDEKKKKKDLDKKQDKKDSDDEKKGSSDEKDKSDEKKEKSDEEKKDSDDEKEKSDEEKSDDEKEKSDEEKSE